MATGSGRISRKSRWLAVAVLATAARVGAQDMAEVRVQSRPYAARSTLHVETELVTLDVVVRDGHGRAAGGLQRSNFRIFDEGKEREIVAFSVDAASSATVDGAPGAGAASASPAGASTAAAAGVRPRFVALFFDDVDTQDGPYTGTLNRAQAAGARYVKDALQPGVRIGIFTASGTQTQEFTADAARLIDTIKALRPHPRISEKGLLSCPRISPYLAYAITQDHDGSAIRAVQAEAGLNECPVSRGIIVSTAEETWRRVKEISTDTLNAIGRAVDHLGQMPGDRTFLLASTGFVGGTLQEQRDHIVDHARRAGVVIHALDAKGLYGEALPGMRPGDPGGRIAQLAFYMKFETLALQDRMLMLNQPMADLAQRTGGAFFHNNNDLNAGFHQLGIAPELTYRLAFRPEDVAADGRYHALKVKLVGAGSHPVTTRPGYFAPSAQAAVETLRSKLDREVAATGTVADFPMEVATQQSASAAGKNAVSVAAHIDIAHLRFAKQNDRQLQRITFVSALVDARGNIVAARKARWT